MPLFKSFFGRKEPKEQDKKEPPPKAKAEEPPPPRTAPVTGGEKAPARMPPSPLEGKKKPGAKSADVGLDDIKSALEQISSVLSSDEDQAQVGQEGETVLSLSLSDLLGLLPPGYVVEGVKPPEGLEKVSVEVDDLFEQLSAGRVAVKVATLVQNFPGEMLLTNAFEDQATVVELPLHLVVAAVNPEALKKRTAQTPGRYTVDHLPNPFEKMGVAQRATAQAPVAQPAEPAEAASVAEVAAAAPEDAAVAAQSPTVADTEATLDEIVAALGVAETPAQTTAEIAAPAEAAVEEAAPAEAVIEAAALAEAAVEAAAPAEAEAPELPPGLRIPGVEAAEEAAAPAEAAVEEAAPVEAEAPELPPGLRIPGVEAAEEAAAPAEA
ncbi:MAG: hypothetical protein JXR37_21705, partial [Kiritimatiellae bacterium]|nr:hypothetical protein [Kiritimatiellia bacterium]